MMIHSTGLRISEAVNLRLDDILRDQKRFTMMNSKIEKKSVLVFWKERLYLLCEGEKLLIAQNAKTIWVRALEDHHYLKSFSHGNYSDVR